MNHHMFSCNADWWAGYLFGFAVGLWGVPFVRGFVRGMCGEKPTGSHQKATGTGEIETRL